jgi:polysaccharide pyruvyl transferase WcaK-like protein
LPKGVRILVLHAWLRGNLGDVLQLSVLLSGLRELRPRALDLAGFPASPADAAAEVLALTDQYLADPFIRSWHFAPAAVARLVFEPWWTRRRKALFSRYDAIVCAPGPYLADYDARAPSALCDIRIARELGLPLVLASHSIGPLSREKLQAVAGVTACIAREPATHDYLRQREISSFPSADLAFLYPYSVQSGPGLIDPPYRLVFLRSNNLKSDALRTQNGALFEGSTLIAEASSDRLVLATSDYRRDARFLAAAARRLGVPWVGCRTVTELVQLVRGSSSVVSDRYHPAICAAVLGKPAQVLSNREPHKMQGLKGLIDGRPLGELQGLARRGLDAVREALRGAA